MGIGFSLFLAQLIGDNEWEIDLLSERTAKNSPVYGQIFGGRRRTYKRKSVHGRPTRRRLSTSH